MPTTANPYFYNPEMANITGNLATAIFGDPEARMKRDYYSSEVQRNQALAGKTQAETHRLDTGNQEFDQLPDIYRQLAPLPGETPIQHAVRTAPLRGRLAQAYPSSNANEAASADASRLSGIFALGGNDDKRTSLVMQGKMPDEDFSGTDARADQVLNNKGGWKDKTERGVANIKAGADVSVARVNQKGQNDRFFGAPITANQGGKVYLAPNDPRFGKVGDADGVVRGNPNEQTVRGAAGSRMLAGDHDPTLAGLFNGSGGVAKGQPMTVNGKSMQDIVSVALGNVSGAMDATNPKMPVIAPAFRASVDPVKLQAAYDAAGQAMQRTRDVNQAAAAFRQTLGIQDGDTFGPQKDGFLGTSLFGSGNAITHAQPAPAAAPAAPAAPVVTAPHQLPAPEQRPDGLTIDSPRGRVMWDRATQSWLPAGKGA